MKVILFGGGGLVGTSLAELFEKELPGVTIVSRSQKNDPRYIQHDALEPFENIIPVLPKTADVVVINSGSISEPLSEADKEYTNKVNYDYVKDILQYAVAAGVKKILYTSTLAFYEKPMQAIVTEDHPIAAAGFYAETKYMAEREVERIATQHDIKWFLFRITSPVNISEISLNKNLVELWLKKGRQGETLHIFGEGQRKQNFIDTAEIAEIYLRAIKKDIPSGVYQLASSASLSMKELASAFEKKFGIVSQFDRSKEEGFSFGNISAEKAERCFNYKFSSSATVIKKLLDVIK